MKCDKCGVDIGSEGQAHCISDLVPSEAKARLDSQDNRVYCGNCCNDVKRGWASVVDEFNPHEE